MTDLFFFHHALTEYLKVILVGLAVIDTILVDTKEGISFHVGYFVKIQPRIKFKLVKNKSDWKVSSNYRH